MNYVDSYVKEIDASELAGNIENAFKLYRVNVRLSNWKVLPDRVIFQVKLKGETRETQLRARMPDVQLKLKLRLFQIYIYDFTIYIIASAQKIMYDHLPEILSSPVYSQICKQAQLPYVVGHDAMGQKFVIDLCKCPHLLLGGSTNSGKTVGLQSMILSMAYGKSPNEVNMILIDVGTNNLLPFEEIPHLSYPVIRNKDIAYQVLVLLKDELERRINLQITDGDRFNMLTSIVLVIDEFPALLAGMENKQASKLLINAVSSLLQRGRHAKVHLALAAQNPTIQNTKVDLGNITTRIAFKCAKRNYSETILGEGGAENLLGSGDMYLKSPLYDELQRIQGANFSPEELQQMLRDIKGKWVMQPSIFKFNISKACLQQIRFEETDVPLVKKGGIRDKVFAEVVIWTLGQSSISCHLLKKSFGLGWDRAKEFMDRLCEWGIIDVLEAKLPRKVLPQCIEDVSDEIIKLLVDNGISYEVISATICNRKW